MAAPTPPAESAASSMKESGKSQSPHATTRHYEMAADTARDIRHAAMLCSPATADRDATNCSTLSRAERVHSFSADSFKRRRRP
jgi:hypothetical protein